MEKCEVRADTIEFQTNSTQAQQQNDMLSVKSAETLPCIWGEKKENKRLEKEEHFQ